MTLVVKICGLRDEQHLQAAIDAGANALGFVFADSVREISPMDAWTISAHVPKHIKRVAVMLHPSNHQWQEVLETFKPDVLQSDADDFRTLSVPATVERWPVYREGKTNPEVAGPYVYEGVNSGQGASVDWAQAAKLAKSGEMILAGGLNAQNIATAVRAVRPFGIDVSSGVESSRGQKDAQRITEFLRAARAAEKEL